MNYVDDLIGQYTLGFGIGIAIALFVLMGAMIFVFTRIGNKQDERYQIINYKVYRNMLYAAFAFMIFLIPDGLQHAKMVVGIGLAIIGFVGVFSGIYFSKKDVSLE